MALSTLETVSSTFPGALVSSDYIFSVCGLTSHDRSFPIFGLWPESFDGVVCTFALQTSQPNASSVILGADGTSDPGEARYWYHSFGLGSRRKYGAAIKQYSHVRRVTLRPDPSVQKSTSKSKTPTALIQQVVFGPPAFSRSTPLAVVAGPRVSLYGTAPSSILNQTLVLSNVHCPTSTDIPSNATKRAPNLGRMRFAASSKPSSPHMSRSCGSPRSSDLTSHDLASEIIRNTLLSEDF